MLIIHAADLHLGASPDAGEPWGKNRKQELWDSFEWLIRTVEEQQADLLLIAGDLFHRSPLLRELREVNDCFASLSKTKVVLIAGNHDAVGANSFYKDFAWADNVSFLGSETISSVKFPELQTEVYGMSYHKKEIRERFLDEIRPENNGYYHILLAHGGDENHIPFTKEKLAKNGFDYIAFGHVHKPGMILPGKAVMAGSLEPTDHTCTGSHGYVRVKVSDGENHIGFVPFASREYKNLILEVTEQDTVGSICRRAAEKIAVEGSNNIYDLVLTGKCHSTFELMEDKLKRAGNIRQIQNRTEISYDYPKLCLDYQGRLLQRYIDSFAGCEEETEKKALEFGTAAILEALGL